MTSRNNPQRLLTEFPRRLSGSKGRYTISRHEPPDKIGEPHYDLFLETEKDLTTWRLSGPPESGPVEIEPSFPHRKIYLDYEGPVSRNRGTVTRHSSGFYTLHRRRLHLIGGPSEGHYLLKEQILSRYRDFPNQI